MQKRIVLLFSLLSISCCLTAQQRLEILQTNITLKDIATYTDSYLWTRNWWLVGNMLVDTLKGGNAIARESKLNKHTVDSLGKVYRKYISPDLVRFGGLQPRVVYDHSPKLMSFIQSSIYEIQNNQPVLLAVLRIQFSKKMHNNMRDINSIMIVPPSEVTQVSDSTIFALLKRKPTPLEADIMGPVVIRK